MKDKNIKKIQEVEIMIQKSKKAGRFNLEKLLSNDENLLDIGERRPIQIYIGTEDDFYEINNFLLYKLSRANYKEREHIETLRCVIWHFRQLQEIQNAENVENRNLNKYGLFKVPMPQYVKNSKGELFDYESRVLMKEYFSAFDENRIVDKDKKSKLLCEFCQHLTNKQRIVILEILEGSSQSEICKKYNLSKQSVSNLYNKAVQKLICLCESR